jgi:rubrerythrin
MNKMNILIKKAFLKELNKLADYVGSYKCPECGYDSHTSEKDQPNFCPKCGATLITSSTSETHVNS